MSQTNTKPWVQNAINAVAVVRDKMGPEYCAFIVQPNTVLTLADARGYADSVFYHPYSKILKRWQHAQKDILSMLAETRDLIFRVVISKNPRGENYTGFDLMNRGGLSYCLSYYSFLTQADKVALLKVPTLMGVVNTLKAMLRQKPAFAKLNRSQIMHIASGVYLGYPEKAILSTVDSYLVQPDEFASQDIPADIRGAAYYVCPQPVYDYPHSLAGDKDIVTHEKLWSQILMDFYTSDMHQGLAKNKKFQKQIKDVSRY